MRARLLELAPEGFEEIPGPNGLELAAYTDQEGAARIRARFPTVRSTPVTPGWEDAWRGFHRPVVAGGVWIGPPWETPPPGRRAVVIDPGRAFGTGAHPTTRLCLELLASVERDSLLDVGCGSGVLAIAAGVLGFAPLVAVDVDPVAVQATRVNAAINGVSVDVHRADALHDPLPAVGVAVANVLLTPVEALLRRLDARVAVTSGYQVGERPAHPGWTNVSSIELDGWAADLLRRTTV